MCRRSIVCGLFSTYLLKLRCNKLKTVVIKWESIKIALLGLLEETFSSHETIWIVKF